MMIDNAIRNRRESDRYVFLDMLRIFACFMVIVNHTVEDVFLDTTPEAMDWWLSLGYFYISRGAVPLFMMISGFTLVDKQDDIHKSLLRIWRMGVVLICFSVLCYICQWVMGYRAEIGFVNFLKSVYSSNITSSYWYLYMYMGLLVMLPFIQRFAKALNKVYLQLFLLIFVVRFSVWPIVNHYIPKLVWSPYFNLDWFSEYIAAILIGYYMKKYAEPRKSYALVAGVVYVLLLVFSIYASRMEYDVTNGSDYAFLAHWSLFPVFAQSVALFYIMMCVDYKGKWSKWLTTVGQCTFGVYLLSDLLIRYLTPVRDFVYNVTHMVMPAMVIQELAVFVMGAVITYALRMIPGVKKYL